MPDFKRVAEEVDEAISILEGEIFPSVLGDVRESPPSLGTVKVVGEALSRLVEPFIIHADEYKLDERAFAEDLKEHLGMLRYALRQILGEEVELEKSHL